MNSTTKILPLAGLLVTGRLVSAAGNVQAQSTAQITTKQLSACYVPATGTVYLIKQPGLRSECASGHVQFSWSAAGDAPAVTPAAVITDPDGWAATGTFGSGVIPVTGPGVRLMWYPRKAALRGGGVPTTQWDDVYIGNYSVALGSGTTASAEAATALGRNTRASGQRSLATGAGSVASGFSSTAMGYTTTASGFISTALGNSTVSSSNFSTAMGDHAAATSDAATAMGEGATASGDASTAMGGHTTASGDFSTAMGDRAKATDVGSTAMGSLTGASGPASTAMGQQTSATAPYSTAMGGSTIASGPGSTAMGALTNAFGDFSTAMGEGTTASGTYSTAMGTTASTNNWIGSFVYGDASSSGAVVHVSDANSFVVRAQRVWFGKSGDQVATAGRYVETSTGAYLSDGGVWTNVSDATRKENFREEDAAAVLENVGRLPIRSWNYKAEDPSIHHLGPTAQDFYAAFHLRDSDKAIGTVDEEGVALLAIQALERRTREQAKEIETLRAEVTTLQAELVQRKQ